MKRPGASATHDATWLCGPLNTPTIFSRFITSIVWAMSSRSVFGDQIGLAHDGALSMAMNVAP
jgi:hypothetical protein